MKRIPLIAGNWKMNGSSTFVEKVAATFSSFHDQHVEVAIFPPFVYLEAMKKLLSDSLVKIGAQNISAFSEGAYTGEISGSILKECQCDYVLVGHSERRALFHESDKECLQKVIMVQTNGMSPILCVGESLKEREDQQAFSIIEQQIISVISDSRVNAENIIIAYEPVWAIGTGKTATPEMAQEMHHFIRSLLSTHVGEDTAQKTRILYGGSVKSDNASMLLAQKDIDGALVGGASLVIESFTDIIRAA